MESKPESQRYAPMHSSLPIIDHNDDLESAVLDIYYARPARDRRVRDLTPIL